MRVDKYVELYLQRIKPEANTNNEQINASSIFSYLNIRGLGQPRAGVIEIVRNFNAIPFLAYWDIYKNYYANKQEEIGVGIHNKLELPEIEVKQILIITGLDEYEITATEQPAQYVFIDNTSTMKIELMNDFDIDLERIYIVSVGGGETAQKKVTI